MLAQLGNILPGGRNEVQSPVLLAIHRHIANFNQYMENRFSRPFEILSNVTDLIERILSTYSLCCLCCLCFFITLIVSAAVIALGVSLGVRLGCDQ